MNIKSISLLNPLVFSASVFATLFLMFSCAKEIPTQREAKIILNFTQYCEGLPLEYDTMKYTNAAGNQYLISEIQYFISDVKLHRSNGTYHLMVKDKDIQYIDTDLPNTQVWEVSDLILPEEYQKISFTLGISEDKNQSNIFSNPPERDMFWPEVLGGGYHYMKLNGKWLTTDGTINPYDFYLGIGQIYSGGGLNTDSISGFVHNNFEVELPNSGFSANEGDTIQFEIRMNVENWFQHPHTWDHNYWGGMIMQNQDAMQTACENGKEDVFSFHK